MDGRTLREPGPIRRAEVDLVSKHDPLGHDRPRMAEALASLKDGLGESDDPFYDGWKRRKGAGDAADNLRALQAEQQRDTIRTEPLLAPDADTQEMRRDDLTDVEVEIPVTEGELEGEPAPGTAPAHDTIEARLDLENLEEQLLDTVAVRVIRYRAFPDGRWFSPFRCSFSRPASARCSSACARMSLRSPSCSQQPAHHRNRGRPLLLR